MTTLFVPYSNLV